MIVVPIVDTKKVAAGILMVKTIFHDEVGSE